MSQGLSTARGTRIAFVIGELGKGGAEYQLYELVRGLDRSRFAPRIFALSAGGYWAGALRDIGVEVISRGRHATVAGSDLPLDPEQRARTASHIQATYREFLQRISQGRGTDVEELDRLGRGYVWLGAAAVENGLVDRLGGLHEAIALAKERAGIAAGLDPARSIFPGPRSLGDQLHELFRSELSASVRRAFLPFDLPEPLAWAWLARDSELAYLPTHWVELR